jgi:hypothetical protein
MATFISRSLSLVRRATGAARARNRSLSHGIEVTRGSRSSTSPRS